MNTTKKIDGRKNPNRKPWTPNLNFSMVDFHERQRAFKKKLIARLLNLNEIKISL